MNYNLDSEHLQMDDAIDIDFGVVLKGMDRAGLWSDFDEEIAAYDASAPVVIRQHDLDNVLLGAVDV